MPVEALARIDRSIEIQAPPERVWRALTDAAELATWFHVTIEGTIAEGSDVWMTSVHRGTGAAVPRAVCRVDAAPTPRVALATRRGGPERGLLARAGDDGDLHARARGARHAAERSETGFDAISLARRAKVYDDNSQGWTEVLSGCRRMRKREADRRVADAALLFAALGDARRG